MVQRCRTGRHRFEPLPKRYSLSVSLTLCCMSFVSDFHIIYPAKILRRRVEVKKNFSQLISKIKNIQFIHISFFAQQCFQKFMDDGIWIKLLMLERPGGSTLSKKTNFEKIPKDHLLPYSKSALLICTDSSNFPYEV